MVKVPHILKAFYDCDILIEDTLLDWDKKVSKLVGYCSWQYCLHHVVNTRNEVCKLSACDPQQENCDFDDRNSVSRKQYRIVWLVFLFSFPSEHRYIFLSFRTIVKTWSHVAGCRHLRSMCLRRCRRRSTPRLLPSSSGCQRQRRRPVRTTMTTMIMRWGHMTAVAVAQR